MNKNKILLLGVFIFSASAVLIHVEYIFRFILKCISESNLPEFIRKTNAVNIFEKSRLFFLLFAVVFLVTAIFLKVKFSIKCSVVCVLVICSLMFIYLYFAYMAMSTIAFNSIYM